MTRTSFLRQFAVVATAGALILSGIALPATAKGPKNGRGPRIEHVRGKSQNKSQHQRGKSAEAKARKAARVTATGTVVAVGADSLTVAVKGGTKSLRGTEAVFSVPADARINRDDVAATLADVRAGDHAAVQATRVDGVLVAKRVNAESPEPIVEEPTETVTEDPTETVTEDPTETVTETPTETVTEGSTDAPVVP